MRRVADADQQVRIANALRAIFQLLSDRRRKPDDDGSMTIERYAAIEAAKAR